jgi:cell division ATPase FtsA
MEVKGRDLGAGLPKTVSIRSEEIREALKEPLSSILESIRITLERCPPELSADLVERGIVMAGGGALLRGIDRMVAKETGLPVHIAEDPIERGGRRHRGRKGAKRGRDPFPSSSVGRPGIAGFRDGRNQQRNRRADVRFIQSS